ncbi:MAG: ATP-binding cassette domain-containing protein [Acetobacteraceae bacterium]|nr:ATP-binding cassette domain-containing protein [Acetobacteraceae bacterium]
MQVASPSRDSSLAGTPDRLLAERDGRAAVVRLSGITKVFGPTRANDTVDLLVGSGDVVGLVGGNGAGKSTLMRVLCGVMRPDDGSIAIDGLDIDPSEYDAHLAHKRGIRMVHQELSLCDNLSVAENFFLEAPEAARPIPGWRRLYRDRAHQALEQVFPGHGIRVDAKVGDLPIGQRQMVEIARVTAAPGVRLIVLDEPTSSLGLERSKQLRSFIRDRAAAGLAFIFISHKLQEVVEIVSRVVVLRNGRCVFSGESRDISVSALVDAMGGPAQGALRDAREHRPPIAADARGVIRIGGALTASLGRDVVLRVGEVVGLAGLEGSGQRDVLHRLFGGERSAHVSCEGRAAFVSGDRQKEGVFPLWDVLANIALGRIGDRWPLAPVSERNEREAALAPARKLKLDPARFGSPILDLSGGNQQKALVARALVGTSDIILFDDPTRGVDVGAKADFYTLIGDVARAGRLVVWHSTEDIEFLECDRVLVFSNGQIVSELVGSDITEGAIVDASFAGREATRADAASGGPSLVTRLVDFAPLLGLVILGAVLTAINPAALSPFGIDLLLSPAIALVLVAFAQMFVVGGSEIDLGVGAFAGLISVIGATLLVDTPAIGFLCLLAGVAGYGVVGALITARRIPAIVVTLGASFVWAGIGYTLQPTPGGSSPDWLTAMFGFDIPGIPTSIALIALAGAVAFTLDRLPLGVVLRGFGNNPAAMTRGGWPSVRYSVIRYVIAGLFALCAGLALTAINTASDINAGGPFTLISVAAVVIGGCTLIGGHISPLGVVAGALILTLLGAVLGALNVSTDYNAAVQGCLLLAMLAMRVLAGRREDQS